ncbi:aldose 1-epimerase [Pseudomassariella vexata]|uniref:Aldose 1-epimerase n=1 Tax=Pseudomassariella vexata TaxID=1141098 RepID=A0A1Y2DFJ2_9PEZI|nr:aldose 1-epimerase [Pseudomassariella vexata]ORY58041.1 aldose 1-epimerase [Pseudomassariella vexata]
MRVSEYFFTVLAVVTAVVGQNASQPGPDGRYTISAEGIKAQFIPYGATLTNLFVKDKNGKDVDIVLGYDDPAYYPKDPGHPVYNAIPGRYVARIGNATYTLDNVTYHTEKNDGTNTLHSGTNNWSFREWNVTAVKSDSITFSILDKSNSSLNMLGDVKAQVTYSVTNGTWKIKMDATSPDRKTPLMLTQHTYFNLDAYKDPSTAKVWNHTLYLPFSSRYLDAGQDAVPTGKILTAAPGSINDFASAPGIELGHSSGSPEFAGNCGADGACEGYNGYFLIDEPSQAAGSGQQSEDAEDDYEYIEVDDEAGQLAIVASLSSSFSGIKAELRTDQKGLTVYSCNWFDGTSALKSTQGLEGRNTVGRSSCVAIEAHDFPDGINHPEWNRTDAEITGPGETYSWESSWTFSTL